MAAFDSTKFGGSDMDRVYCTAAGIDLGMDLYYPTDGGPWPVLVFVHGGGWMEGDKSGVDSSPAAFGYLVASIDYRMAPDFQFPAMIQDVKCAVRYLRAHAGEFNLDPDRIALIGHSAGGHLVALAGAADSSAGWDMGPYLEHSSRVQAVIALSGITDLTRVFPPDLRGVVQVVFKPDQLESSSPITYVSPDDPPFLIVHGDADPVVPVEQAHLLRDALAAAGVPVELVIVQNGGHGLEPVNGGASPTGAEIFQTALQFLQRSLEPTP